MLLVRRFLFLIVRVLKRFLKVLFLYSETYKAPLRLIFGLLEMAGKANMLEEEKTEAACLKDRVSIPNQVFLRAYLKNRTPNRILTVSISYMIRAEIIVMH